MPARLTPLHRFAPHLHTLPASDEASAVDMPIPLPPPTITPPWPPRRGGAGFALPSLDHVEAAVAAMDAGERHVAPATAMAQARGEGYDAGLRDGAERRCWWDMFAGAVAGAVVAVAVVVGGIKAGIWTAAPAAAPAGGAQPAAGSPAPQVSPTQGGSRA